MQKKDITQRIKELKADIKEAKREKDRIEKLASTPLTEQGLYSGHVMELARARSTVKLRENTLEHFKERAKMYKHN